MLKTHFYLVHPAKHRHLTRLSRLVHYLRFVDKPVVFHDTTHADQRRTERALTIDQMKFVILNHDRKVQHRRGEHGGFVYEFAKQVQGRPLVVVAEVKKQECWLITGWCEAHED